MNRQVDPRSPGRPLIALFPFHHGPGQVTSTIFFRGLDIYFRFLLGFQGESVEFIGIIQLVADDEVSLGVNESEFTGGSQGFFFGASRQ